MSGGAFAPVCSEVEWGNWLQEWCGGPISLPAGWESIEAERIWVRGKPMRLTAPQGAERTELNAL